MRILIAGANGKLGHDCMAALAGEHEVTGRDLPDLDITDASAVRELVRAVRPQAIVNCAAFTRVDAAETERDVCHMINAQGPLILAEAARSAGSRLVHVSTDYVFDGRQPPAGGYREADHPNPLSWYGRTKLAGEQMVLETLPGAIVLRTAWLYGAHGSCFPAIMLRKALQDPLKPLWVVNDQHGSPTWAHSLALQIRRLIESDAQGLFHAAGEGRASWFEMAREFLKAVGIQHSIEPCLAGDNARVAARPGDTALNNARLHATGLGVLRDWREDLASFARTHREQLLATARGLPA